MPGKSIERRIPKTVEFMKAHMAAAHGPPAGDELENLLTEWTEETDPAGNQNKWQHGPTGLWGDVYLDWLQLPAQAILGINWIPIVKGTMTSMMEQSHPGTGMTLQSLFDEWVCMAGHPDGYQKAWHNTRTGEWGSPD